MGDLFRIRTKVSKQQVKRCSHRGCLQEAKHTIPFDDKISYYCDKHYAEFYSKWKAGEKRALIE